MTTTPTTVPATDEEIAALEDVHLVAPHMDGSAGVWLTSDEAARIAAARNALPGLLARLAALQDTEAGLRRENDSLRAEWATAQLDRRLLRSALMRIARRVGGEAGDPASPDTGASSEFLALVADEVDARLADAEGAAAAAVGQNEALDRERLAAVARAERAELERDALLSFAHAYGQHETALGHVIDQRRGMEDAEENDDDELPEWRRAYDAARRDRDAVEADLREEWKKVRDLVDGDAPVPADSRLSAIAARVTEYDRALAEATRTHAEELPLRVAQAGLGVDLAADVRRLARGTDDTAGRIRALLTEAKASGKAPAVTIPVVPVSAEDEAAIDTWMRERRETPAAPSPLRLATQPAAYAMAWPTAEDPRVVLAPQRQPPTDRCRVTGCAEPLCAAGTYCAKHYPENR